MDDHPLQAVIVGRGVEKQVVRETGWCHQREAFYCHGKHRLDQLRYALLCGLRGHLFKSYDALSDAAADEEGDHVYRLREVGLLHLVSHSQLSC